MPTSDAITCGQMYQWTPDETASQFVCPAVAAHMKNGSSKPARTSNWFTVRTVPVRVTVVYPYAKSVSEHKAKKWFYAIKAIASRVDELSGKEPARPACMDLTVYLWDAKKQLATADSDIGSCDANTGLNTRYSMSGNAKIMVYRREEAVKTLVHEILHAYQIGEWANDDDDVHERCRVVAAQNGIVGLANARFAPAEAIVDAMAIRITLELFGGCTWQSCVRHAERLAKKLVVQRGARWTQCTNAFEYYILKPIIMAKMNFFLAAHRAGLQRPNKAIMRDIVRDDGSFASVPGQKSSQRAISMRMTPLALARNQPKLNVIRFR